LRHRGPERTELSRRRHPAPRLYAKNTEFDGIALGRHQTIFANHTILLATGHNLSGQQDQRPLRIVYQYQSVHLRSILSDRPVATSHQWLYVATFGYDYFARTQSLVERKESLSVV